MYYSVCPERTSRKTEKGTFEPNARPFMPRGGSLDGGFGIRLTHVSGFGVGVGVTLLLYYIINNIIIGNRQILYSPFYEK